MLKKMHQAPFNICSDLQLTLITGELEEKHYSKSFERMMSFLLAFQPRENSTRDGDKKRKAHIRVIIS